MSWYSVTLGSDEVAAAKMAAYKDAFQKAFAVAGGPRTMALFEQTGNDGQTVLFLTPECAEHASELLEQWGATPCERPSLVGLNLVVGHNEITYYMP
jgi:hypothetical protein